MNEPGHIGAAPQAATSPRVAVLRARSLSKRYPLFRSPGQRLAYALLGARAVRVREHAALADVSFELCAGDALAVIGRNGAGKSTLLQIVAGVLEPSAGRVERPARIASLLELGSGFNPEFTGRENVFLNAAILGMPPARTRERFDAIAAFADIGEYLDRPVKTYSSGMFLRLAFSVAINVEPDLLLVDEALTVGDVFFQQRCYARLGDLRAQGMAVLLVTHSMADAAEFCNTGIVLSQGRVAFAGSGKEAVEYYFHHERDTPTGRAPSVTATPAPAAAGASTIAPLAVSDSTIDLAAFHQFGTQEVRAVRMWVTDERDVPHRVFAQGDWLRVHVDYAVERDVSVPLSGVELLNGKGTLVHGKNSLQFTDAPPLTVPRGSLLRCVQDIRLDVDVGEYTLDVGLAEVPEAVFAKRHRYPPNDTAPQIHLLCHVAKVAAISVVYRHEGRPCLFSHYGAADLPGRQSMTVAPLTGAPDAA